MLLFQSTGRILRFESLEKSNDKVNEQPAWNLSTRFQSTSRISNFENHFAIYFHGGG